MAGLTVAMLLVLRMVDARAAWAVMLGAKPFWLGAAILLALATSGLMSVKLLVSLRLVGFRPGVRRCASAVLASLSLNAVLPGRGGDLAKAYFLGDRDTRAASLLGVVMVERAVDVLVLGLLSMAGSVTIGSGRTLGVAGLVSLAALCGIMLLAWGFRSRWLPAVAVEAGRAAAALLGSPRSAAGLLALSVAIWTTVIGIFGALLASVGAQVESAVVLSRIPLAVLAGTVPISISGIGTRDGALVMLLGAYAKPSAVLAAGFLYTAIAYWLLALLGLAALGRETLRKVRAAVSEDKAPC